METKGKNDLICETILHDMGSVAARAESSARDMKSLIDGGFADTEDKRELLRAWKFEIDRISQMANAVRSKMWLLTHS